MLEARLVSQKEEITVSVPVISSMNRISVIIPSLQPGSFPLRAIKSVLIAHDNERQTEKLEIECIVVSDGSTSDPSINDLPIDSRLIIRCFKTDSVGAAINEGLRAATGNIIGVLSSDDEYATGALDEVSKKFQTHPTCDAVYGKTKLFDAQSRFIRRERSRHPSVKNIARSLCVCPSAIFYRRSTIDKLGPLSESIRYRTRFEFLVRAVVANCCFISIPSLTVKRCIHREDSLADGANGPLTVDCLREILLILHQTAGIKFSRWNLRLGRTMSGLDHKSELGRLDVCHHVIQNACSEYIRQHGPSPQELRAFKRRLHRMQVSSQMLKTVKKIASVSHSIPVVNRKARLRTQRLFRLKYQDPIPCLLPSKYFSASIPSRAPSIGIVTPNLNQGQFIERTIRSVIDQGYPNLQYTLQDAVSRDDSVEIIRRYEARLSSWQSIKDRGQSHAINLGFARIDTEIMAYLNSDDVLMPGCLSCVAQYFHDHPKVDVVYGNRLLIDENDHVINRWVLPKHDSTAIAWADYIPQETLFWRRRAWDAVGGKVDDTFQFAMDWDLILRFREAGMSFARIPRFLGAFRITEQQKTGALIASTGAEEMARLRHRELGRTPSDVEIAAQLKAYVRRQWYSDKWMEITDKVRLLTDSMVDWTSTQTDMRPQRAA